VDSWQKFAVSHSDAGKPLPAAARSVVMVLRYFMMKPYEPQQLVEAVLR
jgi:hypothetical protein